MRERVTSVLNARKGRVSDRLDAVAVTVRRVGEPLHDEPFSKLGNLADEAARTIERVASGLRERDLDELAEDVRGFAKRRPAVFVGAGLAAGLVAARFLKSSGDGRSSAGRRGRPRRGGGRGVSSRLGEAAEMEMPPHRASRRRRG